MTGLKPMGLLKNERGQGNFVLAANDRTQTIGIIQMRGRQWNFLVTGNDRAQTNDKIKNERG